MYSKLVSPGFHQGMHFGGVEPVRATWALGPVVLAQPVPAIAAVHIPDFVEDFGVVVRCGEFVRCDIGDVYIAARPR